MFEEPTLAPHAAMRLDSFHFFDSFNSIEFFQYFCISKYIILLLSGKCANLESISNNLVEAISARATAVKKKYKIK